MTREVYVDPPPTLGSKNPLLLLRYFGAGAFVASLTIGSGELLFPSRLGAMFGYQLLWVFPLVGALKWVMSYSSARHFVLSGAHPLLRWNEVPGPRGWLPLFFFCIFISSAPFFAFFMASLLGNISTLIFAVGDLYLWGTVWIAVSFVLLLIGGYDFIERAQMAILGAMLVCVLIATVYARPDWLAVLHGSFVPNLPDYPGWVLDRYQSFQDRSVWIELTLAVSVIGGVGYDYLCYVALLREKTWGRSHMGSADNRELQAIASAPDHSARRWVKAAWFDSALSMVLVVSIAICFSVLSAVILQPLQLVPEKDNELLSHQARFLTNLSSLLLPLYQLAVVLAFFGCVYGGPELVSRVCYEFFQSVPGQRWKFSQKRVRWFAILYTLLGSLIVLWIKRAFPETRIVDVVTFPAIYAGMVMCAVYCFANPWADHRFLPRSLRMNWVCTVLNVVAGVIFAAIGFMAMRDQKLGDAEMGRWHLVILPTLIVSAMLAARFLYRDAQPPSASS